MSMRFFEAAKQAFSYLEHSGFRLTRIDQERLQYETDQTFVVVEWSVRSGEMNVFFGLQPRKGESYDSFSLRDLLAMENVDAPGMKMPFQVSDENKLNPFLVKMAENTRLYAQSALIGDRMFFRRLNAFRSAQSQAHMQNMNLSRIHSEARQAWKNRELNELVALYAPIEDQLTASEKAKLAYARLHQTKRSK